MKQFIYDAYIHIVYGRLLTILSPYFFAGIFLLAVLYYTVCRKMQWQLLLMASAAFYTANAPWRGNICMLAPLAASYFAALYAGRAERRHRLAAVLGAVLFDAAVLIFFKERGFFRFLIGLATGHRPADLDITAPFGISYLSLMLISYVLDVYWGTAPVQRNPFKFALSVILLPLGTSGPIARYAEMKEQLFVRHRFDYTQFCFGVQRIVWGLFKKMVVADRLALIVGTVYGAYENYAGIVIAVGFACYTLQVYCDFSGCIDIVLGTGQLFGFALPENFRTPFFATSLSEIWRRWHITLGLWVKDYVLYPILKSRGIQALSSFLKKSLGKKNRYARLIPTWCGMFVVWFTVGFWHGGSWKYIFGSGLFFFMMIAGGQLLEPLFALPVKALRINTEAASWRFFRRVRTFALFSASIAFDRAFSFSEGLRIWRRLFSQWNPWVLFDGTLFKLGLDVMDFTVAVIGLLVMLLVSNLEQARSVRMRLAEQNIAFRWAMYLGLVFSVIIFGMYGPDYNANAFIYAGF